MKMYCSLSTGKNIKTVIDGGWGVLVAPSSWNKNRMPDGCISYCIDNGAWTSFQQGVEWDSKSFEWLATRMCKDADFVIVPDVVGNKKLSLDRTFKWIDFCLDVCRLSLIAVQDGMIAEDVENHLSRRVGIFVGGTTEWKLDTLSSWALLAKKHGAYIHVGRVNSLRRISKCAASGVDSVDGTSAIRFPSTFKKLDRGMRQHSMLLGA